MDLNDRMMTLNMDVSELFEIFLHEISKKAGEKKSNEIRMKVLYGIVTPFNLEDFIKGRYKEKTFVKMKKGREVGDDIVKIIISKKNITREEFDDELILRVRSMRSWLWENMKLEKVGDLREMGTPGGKGNG